MDKLFNIGVADSLPEQLKGKVILTNQMTVVLFFVGLLFFIVSFSFLPVAKVALIGIILLSLGVFFLNHYKFHNASRVLISLLPPIALSLIHASIVQTNEPTLPSLSAGFISISFIPFLIFDIREKFFLAPIILAYWAIYLLQGSINQWIDVPMDSSIFYESTLAFVTNIFNISLVSFGLILFQIKNHKSEQENKDLISRLQKKQIKLATQSGFIKKQHETIALANIKLEEKVKDRTRELNEKNVLLNNYFDNLPGVVYNGKVDGTIQPIFISKGSIDVIGEAAEELVEKGIYNTDIVEPEYLKKIAEVSQQAQQAKDFPSGYELTYPIKTQTGRKWVLDKGKFTKAQNGDIFYNGIWLDITAKVEAEDTLRETKEQLQLLLESSEDMITLHNDHGTYLYYNGPKCYDIQAKDIVGKTAYDFFERESAEKITFHIKEVFQNGKSVSFESQLDWMGTKNWFSEYIYPVTDQEGRVKFVAKICRDIQTKKIAEQRLKEKEQLLSTIYNSTKDATGLLKVHPDGTYTLDSVNHSFIKTNERYGARFTEKDIKGINLTSFWKHYLNFSEQEIKTRLTALEQVKTVKENITHQTITYFENIGEVIMDSTLTPILDDQGNCEYILFVIRDNTQSILAEKALKTSQQQLSLIYNNTLDYMGLIRYKEGDDFIVESLNAPMWTWLNRTKATLKPADILEKDLFNYYKKVYGHEDKAIKERIKLFKQVAQTKESITFEGSRKVDLGNESETYLESTLSPILDEEGNVTHVLAVIRDITERKRIENELQASEAHAKALFEYSPIIIWEEDFSEVKKYFNSLNENEITDLNTYFDQYPEKLEQLASMIRVTDVNQKSVEFYETGTKENHIRDLPAYFLEESWEVLKAELIALAKGATTFESEIPIKNQKGEIIQFILQLSIPPEYSETWESVIVSFIDITERKMAESLLNQSKTEIQTQLRQNQLILETMQDGYILTDMNANIVAVNPAYCKLIGYSRDELIGMNINNLEANYSKEQVDIRTQLMKKNGSARFEFNHIRKDGSIIDFDANLSFMQFEEIPLIAAFMRDITTEKKARQELDDRLRFENLLAKLSNEFINLELNNLDEGINNALKLICEFTGFDRSFIVLFDMELNTSSTAYEWCKPGINSVKANFQNVPFNKYPWLINRLKNNEPLVLKSLNELSPLAKQLKEDLEHGNVASLIHVPILWQGDTIGFIGFDAVQHVNYFPEDLAILLRFAGEMIANVLKRKEGEQALRVSEHQLSMIYNNTNEFIGLLRVKNKTDFYIQSFNKAIYDGVQHYVPDLDLNRYIGRKMSAFYKEVLGYSDDLIDSRIAEWKKIVESTQIKITKGEIPIPYKGKPFFAFETNFIPILNQEGDCEYILFVANDMTEKVIAEQAIKASEQRLSLIYNNNMDFIGLIRVYPGNIFKVESINHPAFAFLNKVKKIASMKELIGMEVSSLFKIYFNDSEAEIKERINLLKKVTIKRERNQTQDKFITKKGEDYTFESTLSPIIENDECIQILYVIKDITEKEKAKEALIHSERRLSSVFNGTKDQMAIFNIENDEKIVLEQVNQTFKNAWLKAGIDLNIELIYGKDINFYNRVVLRLSEKKTKERLDLIKQIIHNKKTFSFEDEYYALNDKNYYMEVTITPLLNDFGECSKILFVARDITFKKKADELLISKILETEDRERRRISKDLHDSLGQNLTTASLNLNYLRNAITQIDDSYKIKFQNGIKFLNNAIDESRNIAHNLMPQSIVDFGYAMTIESLFEDLNQTSDTQFVFYENLGGKRLASYQELSLFRITQEAVNNILKHAEASKVTLQLMKYSDIVLLTIEDNGKGFEFNPNTNSNFGLNSMSTRVKALSGTIHIDSSPRIGTSITIEIPL